MAATSGAFLNGLGSSFLCGGKRSQALLGAKASPSSSPAGGARKFAVVEAVAPKKSWIPAVKGGGNFLDPEWLDGSLPGDYGFDPLGLGYDPSFLKWYREAELIRARWAMAAVVGIFVSQAWSGIPWFEAGADPSAIAPFSFGSLLGTQLLLMGWVESKRWVDFFNPQSQIHNPWNGRLRGLRQPITLPTPPASKVTRAASSLTRWDLREQFRTGSISLILTSWRDLSLLRLSMLELRCWPY